MSKRSANYYSLSLPLLLKELKSRNLSDGQLNSELGKFYGVVGLPARQAAARDEAIRRLQEHDKNKGSFKKIVIILTGLVAFLASIVTIVGAFIR